MKLLIESVQAANEIFIRTLLLRNNLNLDSAHTSRASGTYAQQTALAHRLDELLKRVHQLFIRELYAPPETHALFKHHPIIEDTFLYDSRCSINARMRLQTHILTYARLHHFILRSTNTPIIALKTIHSL